MKYPQSRSNQVIPRTMTQMAPQGYSGSAQVAEWQVLKEMAQMMISTGFVSKGMNKPEQVIFAIMAGRELSMGPMWSVQNLQIIEGKVSAKAEAMLALVFKNCPGAVIDFLQNDHVACRIRASRPGQQPFEFGFSLEDAQKAGLTNKDNWKKYTRAMLRSRAVSETCRSMFPDAIAGISSYTPEEIMDMKDEPFKTEPKNVAPAVEAVQVEPPKTLRQLFAEYGVFEADLVQFLGKPFGEMIPLADRKSLEAALKDLQAGKSWADLMDFAPVGIDLDKKNESELGG